MSYGVMRWSSDVSELTKKHGHGTVIIGAVGDSGVKRNRPLTEDANAAFAALGVRAKRCCRCGPGESRCDRKEGKFIKRALGHSWTWHIHILYISMNIYIIYMYVYIF